MKDIVIQQLISMKQQVDALGSQIDAALSLLASPEEEGCKHPPEKRKQLAMGGSAWKCECGYVGGD